APASVLLQTLVRLIDASPTYMTWGSALSTASAVARANGSPEDDGVHVVPPSALTNRFGPPPLGGFPPAKIRPLRVTSIDSRYSRLSGALLVQFAPPS